ncbi:helix-turn-helix transcriptional regulator [Pseudomonas sp. NPDC089734]|uniref:helix-turn-helix transcriptional regulator n=1 Tax=Pseudomonas sp. NPDC089734 TaxID=3364469 RepID=UPI0038189957
MKLKYSLDPRFYVQLGHLISSTGSADFAGQMLQLINGLMPIHGLDLSEWTLDMSRASVSRIDRLGTAGQPHDSAAANDLRHPLLPSIMQMEAPLLIQLKASLSKQNPQDSAHQCNLVSSSGERRWVICFYRLPGVKAFSLAELSMLKSLSDTLLPLVEHHAQLMALPTPPGSGAIQDELDTGSLHQAFSGRLAQDAITLSAREQEVCLGLLTGGTVPEMAQRLKVKNSSVETYLKRATAKLGISGRHGLARWMAGA